MKRRPRLSLDREASGETKQVPGFETEQLAAASGPAITTNEQRSRAWSSAPPSARRVDPIKHVAPPRRSSGALAKGLVIVVLGALTVYLLKRRVF